MSHEPEIRETKNPAWTALPYSAETFGFWAFDLTTASALTHHHPWTMGATLAFDVTSTALQSSLASSGLLNLLDRYRSYEKIESIAKQTRPEVVYSVSGVDFDYSMGLWAKSMKSCSLYFVKANGSSAQKLEAQPEHWTKIDPEHSRIRVSMHLAGFDDVLPSVDFTLEEFLHGRTLPADIAKIWKDAATQWSKRLPLLNRRLWVDTIHKAKVTATLLPAGTAEPISIGDLLRGREVGIFLNRDPGAIVKDLVKQGAGKVIKNFIPGPTQKIGGHSTRVIASQECKKGLAYTFRRILGKTVVIQKEENHENLH